METGALIERLAAEAGPVRRLPPPGWRAGAWFALAAGLVGMVAFGPGCRQDFAAMIGTPVFLALLGGSVATAGLSAVAALLLAVPGRSRAWALLPLPAAGVWAVALALSFMGAPEAVLDAAEAWRCAGTILLVALPLGVALVAMLVRAAPVWGSVAPLVALAAGGMAETAMLILHPVPPATMVVGWAALIGLGVLGAARAAGRLGVG